MRKTALILLCVLPWGLRAEETATAETELTPLQSREVIERLKTMRAQLLLEQEYNRLLEERVKRMEFETQLGIESAKTNAKKDLPKAPPQLRTATATLLGNGARDLVVKAVTVQPFKEAFVVYKGRVYTVRPGDKLGNLTVKDITENGVVTNKLTVNME